MSEIKKKKQVL